MIKTNHREHKVEEDILPSESKSPLIFLI